MVAKEVIIKSKSFRKDEPAVWWKSDGSGDYEIAELTEPIKRGTTIEIHLRDDAKEFADKYRLEGIIKKHSNFISFQFILRMKRLIQLQHFGESPKLR